MSNPTPTAPPPPPPTPTTTSQPAPTTASESPARSPATVPGAQRWSVVLEAAGPGAPGIIRLRRALKWLSLAWIAMRGIQRGGAPMIASASHSPCSPPANPR